MQDPVNESTSSPAAWAMPVAAVATVVGLAALFAGLFALASGADTSRFAAPETDDTIDSLPDFSADGGGGSGDGQSASDQSESDPAQNEQAQPGTPLQDGQVLPPSAIRDLAQAQLDRTDRTALDVGDHRVDVTRHPNGVIELRGPSGKPLFIAPDGVPAGNATSDQTGNLLVPSPNGGFSGVRVDENGDVVPVPVGEETADTLPFGFGTEGAQDLRFPGSDDSLRITPEGSDAHSGPLPEFGANSDDDRRPSVRRDAIQAELDLNGSTAFSLDGAPVEVRRLPNGAIEITGPDGTSTYLYPDGVPNTGGLPSDAGNALVPSPDGPYSGLRVDENGRVVPVPRGEETPDTMLFGYGPEGARELFLPGAQGEALRVSPDGQESLAPPPGVAEIQPQDQQPAPSDNNSTSDPSSSNGEAANDDDGRGINWAPILIAAGVALLVVGAVAAMAHFGRREREAAEIDDVIEEPRINDDLIAAVTDLSAQIEVEPDPREAILRAYAQVESGFTSQRLVRSSSESPKQFLERAFADTPGAHDGLARLTSLFELARFSDYPVTDEMRDDALRALAAIREACNADRMLIA